MKRGEIWWANLPEPTGAGPGFRRPVLIIQSNEFTQSALRTVVVAVLTSNVRRAGAPGNVKLSKRDSGLRRESVVNVSQLVTLDKSILSERVNVVPSRILREVDAGLRLVLSL